MGSRMSTDTNTNMNEGPNISNAVLDKISTIYKCELVDGKSNKSSRMRKFLATEEFYPEFKEALDSGKKFSVTGKVDGSCCYVYHGRLMKRRDVKVGKSPPEGWMLTAGGKKENNGKDSRHRVGFVDVSMTNPEDKWIRKVILRMGYNCDNESDKDENESVEVEADVNEKTYIKTLVVIDGETLIQNVPIEQLEGRTVEFVGPNVQKNDHKFEEFCVVPHGMFPLSGFPKDMNYDDFVNWFKNDRLAKYFEGVVIHFENGKMFKIHRHHLDMKWEASGSLHYLLV